MRDSFIFYRSFYEAINQLSTEQKAELFTSICEFSLNKNEPALSGVSKTVWILIRPQLEANYKKFENGKKAKAKQTISKVKANHKQTISKSEANVNVNVNDNKNVNKKILFINSPYYSKKLFAEQFPDWSREKLAYYYDAVLAWSNEGNKKIDWIATVKNWAKRDEKEGKITFNKPTPTILQGII